MAGVRIGCKENAGRLVVLNKNGHDVFDFRGQDGSLRVGGNGNDGKIIVKNRNEINRIFRIIMLLIPGYKRLNYMQHKTTICPESKDHQDQFPDHNY